MLLISNMYPDNVDKYYGIFVKNFVNGFKSTEIEITSKSLIKGKAKGKSQKLRKYLLFYLSICRNVIMKHYDIIYIHYPTYISPVLLPLLPFISKPIILNFHGTDVLSSTRFSKFLRLLLIPIIKRSNTVIAPSSFFKEIISNKLNVKPGKIFISPSGGLDTIKLRPKIKENTQHNFTLGFVGRIDAGKGWDILLKSLILMKAEIPHIRLLIAGDGPEREKLKHLIKELDVSDNISYNGAIDHHQLPNFYNQLDVFIFPTLLNESLGLVGLEAMSCGVPVVGSRIGGLKDYIIDGVNGSFFEPGDSEDLAQKVLEIYNNKQLLEQLRNTSRHSIKAYDKHFVSKELASKLEEISSSNE